MLPLQLLLTSYEALSLTQRARALVLAREVGNFAAHLLGAADRTSGIVAWQRLVIEEGLLRGIVTTEEAVALMRHTLLEERSDPRLELFLSTWAGDSETAPAPPARRLHVLRGGRAGDQRSAQLPGSAREAYNGEPLRRS
jgi:hypothetical protein